MSSYFCVFPWYSPIYTSTSVNCMHHHYSHGSERYKHIGHMYLHNPRLHWCQLEQAILSHFHTIVIHLLVVLIWWCNNVCMNVSGSISHIYVTDIVSQLILSVYLNDYYAQCLIFILFYFGLVSINAIHAFQAYFFGTLAIICLLQCLWWNSILAYWLMINQNPPRTGNIAKNTSGNSCIF